MGSIADAFASVYRDYVTTGLPASGDHEPVKADIRAIGPLIEAALGTIGLGSVGVTKTTRALLNADLAHAADTIGLVYADATDANNDLYVKVGGSGVGSWTLTGALHGIIGGLAQPYVDAAEASAEQLRDLVLTGAVSTYDLPGYTAFDSGGYSAPGAGVQMPAQGADVEFNQVTVYGGCEGPGIMRGYAVDTGTATTHAPSDDDTLIFTHAITWSAAVAERVERLDAVYTVPSGKELHVLWVALAATNVAVGRWGDGNALLPLIRFSLTGAGDEAGIWDETWYNGTNLYRSVPVKLELATGEVSGQTVPQFTIPANLKAVVGNELSLQHDAIVSAHSVGLSGLTGYSCAIVGPKGKNEERSFRFTPVVGDIGTHSFTAKLKNAGGGEVATRDFTVTVVAATPKGSAKNFVMAGNSLTGIGTITATVQANFAALGATVPTFVGSQKVNVVTCDTVAALAEWSTYTSGGVTYTVGMISGNRVGFFNANNVLPSSGTLTKVAGSGPASIAFSATLTLGHEGFGGKSFAWFASSGDISYRVTVSGVTAASVGAVYTTGSVNYTVAEVNITAGSGNILLTGASAPGGSGTLTKVSGSGDSSIAYSAVANVPGNPFWNTGTSALDIAHYRSVNSIASPIDAVTIELGLNDVFGEVVKAPGEIAAMVTNAEAIADAFLADNASCIVIFELTTLCGNTADGFGDNYGATYSREIFEANIFALRAAMIEAFDAGAYHANVKVGAAGLMPDRYYGYALAAAAVSARITTTANKHVNALHPMTAGFQQIGDQIYAELMAWL